MTKHWKKQGDRGLKWNQRLSAKMDPDTEYAQEMIR